MRRQCSDSSEEEQRKEEWRRKERKSIKGKKERRQVEEHNRQRRWNKDYDNREEEIKRREYRLAIRGNVSDREDCMTSPSQTNLTSLTTTTRYMIEEVRNLCRIMERILNLEEEMFLRFEDRQKKQEELFYKMTKGERNRSREEKEREEERRWRLRYYFGMQEDGEIRKRK